MLVFQIAPYSLFSELFFSPISIYLFSPQSRGIQLVVHLVSSLQLPYGEGREPCVPQNTTPTKPHCFLTPRSQPHQCVGGNTVQLATVSVCTAPGPPQESLVCDGTRTSLPAKPSPNLDDAGPILRCPMGLPVAAGCDRAWTRTQNL